PLGEVAPEPAAAGIGELAPTPIMCWLADLGASFEHFHQSMLVSVPPDLDPEALTRALQALVDHHDLMPPRLPPGDGVDPGPLRGGRPARRDPPPRPGRHLLPAVVRPPRGRGPRPNSPGGAVSLDADARRSRSPPGGAGAGSGHRHPRHAPASEPEPAGGD